MKKYAVAIHTETKSGAGALSLIFVDAENENTAFGIACGEIEIQQFSKMAWVVKEIDDK